MTRRTVARAAARTRISARMSSCMSARLRARLPARALLAVAAAAVLAVSPGRAQGAPAGQTYDLVQSGRAIGSYEMSVVEGAGGASASSTLTITGALELRDRLTTDADGHATAYHLEGTVRGAPVVIDVAFEPGKATETVQQAGRTSTVTVDLAGPAVVLDNSLIDGWQVLAARVTGSAPVSYDVLVPQAALAGTVTLTPAGEESVDLASGPVRARRLDALLHVGPQTVGVTLWVGADGALVRLEQPSAALRYELRPPAGAGGQEGAAAQAATAQEAATTPAEEALQRTLVQRATCVEERQARTTSTGQTLAGALTVPKGAERAPALLLLPGSGAVDMDGNEPPVLTNGIYRQLAYALGCDGYAVLRINKLGLPPSTGDANAVTIDTYATNTRDWLAYLRAQPGIDPHRVGLIGHSEGGLIALYAAATGAADPLAIVLLASPGLPFDQVVLDQMALQARLRGVAQAEIDANDAMARQAFDAIRASRGTRLELTGELASNPIAAAFAHAAGLLRSEMAPDPAELASRLAARGEPLLIVQGGKDVQVSDANGEALRRAAPDATFLRFPELSHHLADVTGPAIEGALPGPGTQLSPALERALRTWLAGYLMAGR